MKVKLRMKRIEEVLEIQANKVDPNQHGRRAAMRKVLAPGKWHKEDWTTQTRRLYLDVIHAWNYAANQSIAPDAGTMYESTDDIPLSTYGRTVTDIVGWFRTNETLGASFPEHICRLLRWDLRTTDWKQIARIARITEQSAKALQHSLHQHSTSRGERLEEHASNVADCLVGVPMLEIPEWVWGPVKFVASILDYEDYIELAEKLLHYAPPVYGAIKHKFVVNTISNVGKKMLVNL